MLDQNIKAQLKAYLERLESPLNWSLLWMIQTKLPKSKNWSLKLQNSDQVTHVLMVKIHAVQVWYCQSGEQPRVFFALPMGHEFTSLILALLQTSGYAPKVSDECSTRLKV
jgi:alkyl hydroperoxide reductase subunit F